MYFFFFFAQTQRDNPGIIIIVIIIVRLLNGRAVERLLFRCERGVVHAPRRYRLRKPVVIPIHKWWTCLRRDHAGVTTGSSSPFARTRIKNNLLRI